MFRNSLQKLKLTSLLLLVCFSIYSTSPLAVTFQQSKSDTIQLSQADEPGLRIYVVHYLLSSLNLADMGETNQNAEDEPVDHCLIKKKRAVLSSKSIKSLLSLNIIETVSPDAVFFDKDVFARSNIKSFDLKHSQYPVLPLFSANPPPSV